MTSRQEYDLLDACRILFPTADINRDFLYYIQPEGLKNAYRNRAWECHPDACGEGGEQSRRTELFRRSVEAYNQLVGALESRVLVSARRMHEAGVVEAPLPAPTPVETGPRVLTALELIEAATAADDRPQLELDVPPSHTGRESTA